MDFVYRAVAKSHDYVLLLGADSPQLSREALLSAIRYLDGKKGYVVGPARDGGFWLCGGNTEIEKYVDIVLRIPPSHELLSPILSSVVLQLLAYYTALARGCSIDKPRNLAKSVTVE